MTKDEKDAIRARCEAATPGPWSGDEPCSFVLATDHKGTYPILMMRGWGHLTGTGHGALGLSEDDAFERQKADQRFIAYARQDIPALLSALEEAETDRDHWKAERDRWKKQADKYEDRLVISPYGDDKIDELEDAMEYAKADRDQWKLLAEQNLKTAELALAESDHWKARAEALERAMYTSTMNYCDGDSCCYFCKYGPEGTEESFSYTESTTENGSEKEWDCKLCNGSTISQRGGWQFDEARFSKQEDTK